MIGNNNLENIQERNAKFTIASVDGVGVWTTPRTRASSTIIDWHIELRGSHRLVYLPSLNHPQTRLDGHATNM